ALREAIYFLCRVNRSAEDGYNALDEDSPVALNSACRLLSRLVIHEWSADDLRKSVANISTGVFATGTGHSALEYLRGALTTTIVNQGFAAETLGSFISKIGTLSMVISVSGEFRRLLQNYSAAHFKPRPLPICWERLDDKPEKLSTLAERLGSF